MSSGLETRGWRVTAPTAGRAPRRGQSKFPCRRRLLCSSLAGIICGLAAGSAFAAPWIVTSTSDDVMDTGSLRHAVVNAAPGDTITFDLPSYPATIQLTGSNENALLEIQKSLTIIGPGATSLTIVAVHDENSAYNAFNVSFPPAPDADIDVAISGLRIEHAGTAVWSSGYPFGTDFKLHLTLADMALVSNFDGVDVDYTATATISNSTISGGYVGIDAYSYADAGGPSNVTIERTTISGNYGGVHNGGSNVTIVNSTLADNGLPDEDDYWAGVIADAGSNTTLAFSTVSGSANVATPGLRSYEPDGIITLKNTVIAGHAAGNCDVNAQVSSLGHNLSDDASCSLGKDDFVDTPAGLDPAGLADHGGATQTIALLPDSPAMDAVPLADCTDAASDPVVTDQRGSARPVGSGCEIGAWELDDRIFSSGFD
jgi:hypothetical protein